MASVTERVKQVGNPGRFIKMSGFEKQILSDDIVLSDNEGGVSASNIASAVEYLTRFFMQPRGMYEGEGLLNAFEVSKIGAASAEAFFGFKGATDVFMELCKEMLNAPGDWDKWCTNACKLVTFDAWYRHPSSAMKSRTYKEANPDGATIENIRLMVKRSVKFFHERGPVISTGFDFSPSGYTATVHSGDGDFLTEDTLWDMKVRRDRLRSEAALQILMYWVMGQHSGQEIFKGIKKIGLYNPRQNVAYTLDVAKIPASVIREVEEKVICYESAM